MEFVNINTEYFKKMCSRTPTLLKIKNIFFVTPSSSTRETCKNSIILTPEGKNKEYVYDGRIVFKQIYWNETIKSNDVDGYVLEYNDNFLIVLRIIRSSMTDSRIKVVYKLEKFKIECNTNIELIESYEIASSEHESYGVCNLMFVKTKDFKTFLVISLGVKKTIIHNLDTKETEEKQYYFMLDRKIKDRYVLCCNYSTYSVVDLHTLKTLPNISIEKTDGGICILDDFIICRTDGDNKVIYLKDIDK